MFQKCLFQQNMVSTRRQLAELDNDDLPVEQRMQKNEDIKQEHVGVRLYVCHTTCIGPYCIIHVPYICNGYIHLAWKDCCMQNTA